MAVKILPPDLEAADATFSERFRNEAMAMARLNHPGLVGVYDFGKTANGMLYIVMEFVDGTDVAKMMERNGRISSDHAMAITAHVCDALKYAHERGIVHRDIKPANIMVGYDGVVKVADFGLAKVKHDGQSAGLTQSGMAMGTLHYIAPEALILGTSVDQRADIYAMGVMLYHMLTGELPHGLFELPSLQVPGLDPRYDGIISRALRNDRDKRYQNVGELRRDLDAILTQPVARVEANAKQAPAALNTMARPQRPSGQPYRPPQRQPASAPQSSRPPTAKKSGLGFWLPVIGATAVCAGFVGWAKWDAQSPAKRLLKATKESPFINSLGMKFIPVPGTKILMCIHETRREDYEAYAKNHRATDAAWRDQKFNGQPCGHLNDHPVVGVSWKDAQAFCQWLSQKEGLKCRLPTDREWSQAAGIGKEETGDETPQNRDGRVKGFTWGGHFPPTNNDQEGNYGDTDYKAKQPKEDYLASYTDGFASTAPVMSFKANRYGLHDIGGNAREWVEDWWDAAHTRRLMRGSAWHSCFGGPMQTSSRHHRVEDHREYDSGFRCVIEAAVPFPEEDSKPVRTSSLGHKALPSPNHEVLNFGGHRYQFIPERIPWHDARDRASQMGGHLATLTTTAENEWAGRAFLRHLPGMYANMLLGGYRQGKDWHWVTGEAFKQTFWHPGEPNAPGDKAYLHLWRAQNESEAIDWDDTWDPMDHSSVGFLVEWDDDGRASS